MKRILLMFLLMILLPSLLIVSFPSSKTRGLRIVTKDGKVIPFYEKSYALVIGVGKYTKGWQALESIPKEIDEVEVTLKKHGFKVEKVMNPTYEELKRAFDDFINKYGFNPNNRLLFFFSGHGYTRKRGKKGYIVPSDAPNPVYNERGFVQKSVEMEQVMTWAKRIEAKHALFLFDSCFSGMIFKAKDTLVPRDISYLSANDVRQFISAGSAGQKVPAKSVFTPSFIRGINGEADLDKDGYVTGTELGLYLQKKVLSYKKGQTPQYGKIRDPELDEGDFVFVPGKRYEPPSVLPNVDFSHMGKEAKWAKWQNNFQGKIDILKEYDKNDGIAADSKKNAWERLLEAYNQDNPYSDEDEQLRAYAKERIIYWKNTDDDKPADVKAVESKAKNVYKNDKGFWEADYGDGILMVYIPASEFTMGSNDGDNDEKPPHKVQLDGYWIGKYEVTFDQYEKYCEKTNKKKPSDRDKGRGKRPVINVSWNDADEYCKWLSKKIGLKFKLPTEAQWEKAARGTDNRKYPWGDSPPSGKKVNFADKQVWLKDKYSWADKDIDDGYAYTAPVESYPQGASPYGILNMAGNVWEWCNDWYGSDYYKKSPGKNPIGPTGGTYRVMRGGGWDDFAGFIRCALRSRYYPSYRYLVVGFRICQDNK
jgi:formylglycine-generating enzyme required for sulfatase activity